MKPVNILKQKKEKIDVIVADIDIMKIKGELTLTKSCKSEELSKSETSAEISFKNEDTKNTICNPKPASNKFKSLKKRSFCLLYISDHSDE